MKKEIRYASKKNPDLIAAIAITQNKGDTTYFEVVKEGPDKCPDWIGTKYKKCKTEPILITGDK